MGRKPTPKGRADDPSPTDGSGTDVPADGHLSERFDVPVVDPARGEGHTRTSAGYDPELVSDNLHEMLPAGTVIDRYEIIGPLGAGGFGKVYLSSDPDLEKAVALKEYWPEGEAQRDGTSVRPSPGSEEKFRKGKRQFLEEARVIASLEHPSIVDIYAIEEANNTFYMVMEYLGQRTLTRYLADEGGRLTQDQALGILLPVLDAVDIVHGVGKVHRDISPDNIMVAPDGTPVLLDFGTVRDALLEADREQRSHVQSKSQAIVNTGFSAPEIYGITRTDFQPATDIYSLAAVLYMLVTGVRPAASTDRFQDDEIPGALLPDGQLRSLSMMELNGPFDAHFLAAVERGLSLKVKDRPVDIATWREQLIGKRALPTLGEADTEAVRPGPTSGSRAPLMAVAGVAVALGAAGLWFALGGREAAPPPRATVEPADPVEPAGPAVDVVRLQRLRTESRDELDRAGTLLDGAIERGTPEPRASVMVRDADAMRGQVRALSASLDTIVTRRDMPAMERARQDAERMLVRAEDLSRAVDRAVVEGARERRDRDALEQQASELLTRARDRGAALQAAAAAVRGAASEVDGTEAILARVNQAVADGAAAVAAAESAAGRRDLDAVNRAIETIAAAVATVRQARSQVAQLAQGQANRLEALLALLVTETGQLADAARAAAQEGLSAASGLTGLEEQTGILNAALATARRAVLDVEAASAARDEGAARSARDAAASARDTAAGVRDTVLRAREERNAADAAAVVASLAQGRADLSELRGKASQARSEAAGIEAAAPALATIEAALREAERIEVTLASLEGTRRTDAAAAAAAAAASQLAVVDDARSRIAGARQGVDAALAALREQADAALAQAIALRDGARTTHGQDRAVVTQLAQLERDVEAVASARTQADRAIAGRDVAGARTALAAMRDGLAAAVRSNTALDEAARNARTETAARLREAGRRAQRLQSEGENALAALREDVGEDAAGLAAAATALEALRAAAAQVLARVEAEDVTGAEEALDRVRQQRLALRDAIAGTRSTGVAAVLAEIAGAVTGLRSAVRQGRAEGTGVEGAAEAVARVEAASVVTDEIEARLRALEGTTQLAPAQDLLARARTQQAALDAALGAIGEARRGQASSLQALAQEGQRVRDAAAGAAGDAARLAEGRADLAGALATVEGELAKVEQELAALNAAVSANDAERARVAAAATRNAGAAFDIALANLRRLAESGTELLQAALRAAREALSSIQTLREQAREQADGVPGAREPLERIEVALAAATTAVEATQAAVAANDRPGAERGRDGARERLDEARTALLDVRRAVEEAERAPAVIEVSELDAAQRTGVYRGLFRLGFLPDQEIDERYLAFGEESAPIRAAVTRFNEARGRQRTDALLLGDLAEITAAAGDETDWERERTIPLIRLVDEADLWNYGINRRLGLYDFAELPTVTQGSPARDRSAIATFQTSIDAQATGFFADQAQMMRLLARPMDLSVANVRGTASRDWHYFEDEQQCYIRSFATRMEGPYLRPDTPMILFAKEKGEDTPGMRVYLGPSAAFAPGDITATSDSGATAALARDDGGLTVARDGSADDRTIVRMLVRDRTVTVAGPSQIAAGAPLRITYSALGFTSAFGRMEQGCTLEIGFWRD